MRDVPHSYRTVREWLDSKDFYELCQSYRHAGDVIPRAEGFPTACEAYEALKDEIEKRVLEPNYRNAIIEECAKVCDENSMASAEKCASAIRELKSVPTDGTTA